MARPRKTNSLSLWMNGEYVGRWTVTSQGQHELYYAQAWVESKRGRPISLSMPLRPMANTAPYRGDVVRNYFENLLPDNESLRRRAAQRFGTTTKTFDLLAEIGRDCVGALQILAENARPKAIFGVKATPLSEEEIERHLSNAISSAALPMSKGAGDGDDEFRISIAGNQEKTALLLWDGRWCHPHGSTPTSHIFKLPLGLTPRGLDLTTSVENEWLCMQILRGYNVPCAKTEILQFGKHQILSVERFDREIARPGSAGSWIRRLPQEDFAQVVGVDPNRKYEEDGGPGVKQILGQLIGSSRSAADRNDFFRTLIIYWMLAAIDGHAKNFSVFLRPRGEFSLTPRYDVLSAYPIMGKRAGQIAPEKAKMAMALLGKNHHYAWSAIQRRHFENTAAVCGIPDAGSIIDDLVAQTQHVVEETRQAIPQEFPHAVADSILSGLVEASRKLGFAPPSPHVLRLDFM